MTLEDHRDRGYADASAGVVLERGIWLDRSPEVQAYCVGFVAGLQDSLAEAERLALSVSAAIVARS